MQLIRGIKSHKCEWLIYKTAVLCVEYPVLSLVSTLFNMTPVLFSVDTGVDTEQRWIFLKNIIISLI